MKQKPKIFSTWEVQAIIDKRKTMFREVVRPHALWAVESETIIEDYCPYSIGDTIYVREKYLPWLYTKDNSFSHVAAYAADGYELESGESWRSPATMPREAARIFLEVVGVKCERLAEITQDQAKKEGVVRIPHRCGGYENPLDNWKDCYRCAFRMEWNKAYGLKGLQFDSNPWVFAVEFKRIDKPLS